MDISKVTLMYFSPTGGTARVGRIAAGQFRAPVEEMDLTGPIMPRARDFGPHDLVIAATPCYGGRVPEPVARRLTHMMGRGTPAIPIVAFGGRAHDDALRELSDILTGNGCVPVAAAAVATEYKLDSRFNAGRPDEHDCAKLRTFAIKARVKIGALPNAEAGRIVLENAEPYKKPITTHIKPVGNDKCISCGMCARMCPVGAIDPANPTRTDGSKCILCMRCVKDCPRGARDLPVFVRRLVSIRCKYMSGWKAENSFIL